MEAEDFCEYFAEHGDHNWTEPVEIEPSVWYRKCKTCGFPEYASLQEEYWEDEYIEIKGKKYKALKAWGEISTCAHCGKVIMDVPLILWDANDPRKAITFHMECAEEIGILEMIKQSVKERKDHIGGDDEV
ncbi:hypothetical protein DRP07_00365 [Archaeoglobales archaeon]|nr:MAG: hypothetical protein DRP07_00365 [Archaeoglobales archaeon]